MDGDLLFRITSFFDFWRRRVFFIEKLDYQTNNYEANILIWSCLDALSNLWEKEIGKDKCEDFSQSKRLIFGEFLSHYYPDIFNQVSLPHIWNRLEPLDDKKPQIKIDKFTLPKNIISLLANIKRSQKSETGEIRKTRNITDDLPIDVVLKELSFECKTEELAMIKKWLKFSSYGTIAYEEMRNSYIHEGRAGKQSHGFKLHGSEIRPTYFSRIYETPPKMGFSVEFMLEVLSSCIDSFEKDAIELQQDPAPNKVD